MRNFIVLFPTRFTHMMLVVLSCLKCSQMSISLYILFILVLQLSHEYYSQYPSLICIHLFVFHNTISTYGVSRDLMKLFLIVFIRTFRKNNDQAAVIVYFQPFVTICDCNNLGLKDSIVIWMTKVLAYSKIRVIKTQPSPGLLQVTGLLSGM